MILFMYLALVIYATGANGQFIYLLGLNAE